MRGRINDGKSYVPPFELGKPLDGGAVGEVIESRSGVPVRRDTLFAEPLKMRTHPKLAPQG